LLGQQQRQQCRSTRTQRDVLHVKQTEPSVHETKPNGNSQHSPFPGMAKEGSTRRAGAHAMCCYSFLFFSFLLLSCICMTLAISPSNVCLANAYIGHLLRRRHPCHSQPSGLDQLAHVVMTEVDVTSARVGDTITAAHRDCCLVVTVQVDGEVNTRADLRQQIGEPLRLLHRIRHGDVLRLGSRVRNDRLLLRVPNHRVAVEKHHAAGCRASVIAITRPIRVAEH